MRSQASVWEGGLNKSWYLPTAGVLLGHKKEWSVGTWYGGHEPGKHDAKLKPGMKDRVLYDSIYMTYLEKKR